MTMAAKTPGLPANAELDRDAVQQQLERILKDPLFLNSKRYPSLLRYVVSETLDGRMDQLKERTLGMEVFGRDPEYDTNLDNVVRSTAGEIRKRLAQYYQAPQHKDEIRIDLPSGSYVPRFHAPVEAQPPVAPPPPSPRKVPVLLMAGIGIATFALAVFTWMGLRAPGGDLDRFWEPVINSPGSVLLCTGTVQSLAKQMAQLQSGDVEAAALAAKTRQHVTLEEASALMRFGSLLNRKEKPLKLRYDSSTSLADLKIGPAILIGAMNNEWTVRMVAPLRFNIQWDEGATMVWISDRQHPSRRDWAKVNAVPSDKVSEDFALVSRFRNETTGQVTVISAGLYRFGTIAAAEFLTDPGLISELAAAAPPGWDQMNIQVVIATRVINSEAGRPRIVATHFW
jgi:hypothetical protein